MAITLASVISGPIASAATETDIPHDQCRTIAAITADVIRAIGPQTLTLEFRTSLRDFLMTDGEMTCQGSRDIFTITPNDSAAFATIRSQLLDAPTPISLHDAGVQAVRIRR